MKRRVLNLLISLDQFLLCVVTLGASNPDETASSAAWRAEKNGKFFGFFRPIIDKLFWLLERDHCRLSYEEELIRKQKLVHSGSN